jgi:hypothetical protein
VKDRNPRQRDRATQAGTATADQLSPDYTGSRGPPECLPVTLNISNPCNSEKGKQEVYVEFNPQFERIWLEAKKRLTEYMAKKPSITMVPSQYSLRLYGWAKKACRGRNHEHFAERTSKGSRLGIGQGYGRKRLLRSRLCRSGLTSARERSLSRFRRSTVRRT